MAGEVVREHSQRRLKKHHSSVGVVTSASTCHFRRPAVQPLQVNRIRAALGDPGTGLGESAQSEEARSALGGAFAGQVPHDPGDLTNDAPAAWQHADHTATNRKPMDFEHLSILVNSLLPRS